MRRPEGGSEVTPLQTDEWPKRSSKKDTKRWCKGKVGREHDWETILDPKSTFHWTANGREVPKCSPGGRAVFGACRHIKVCTKCGKEDWWNVECPGPTE